MEINDYADEFKILTKEYLDYNSHTNISAIRGKEEIYEKHYCDSLVLREWVLDCLGLIDPDASNQISFSGNFKVLDLGSGGGFPVLPLAITMAKAYPSIKFIALDSVAKKTKFIEHLKNVLELGNLEVVTARAEALAQDESHRETYDLVLARSVANLSTLLEYSIPFLKKGSYFIASKSRNIAEEISMAQNAMNELCCAIEKTYKYNNKQLLFVKKIENTKQKYPRPKGKPLKSPL